jgi:hypothetical protein
MYCNRVVLAMLVLPLLACSPQEPEAALRNLLAAAETAAEARDTGFFRSLIAAEYVGPGGQSKDELIDRLRGYFLLNSSVEVLSFVEKVELTADSAAQVVVRAAVLGRGRAGAPLGLDADFYRIELELVRQGSDWRIIGADWGRARD